MVRLREYIAKTDRRCAALVARRIRDSSETLAMFPFRGRAGEEPDTRELMVPRTPYIVVYRVRESVVEILRVIHGAQQWPET